MAATRIPEGLKTPIASGIDNSEEKQRAEDSSSPAQHRKRKRKGVRSSKMEEIKIDSSPEREGETATHRSAIGRGDREWDVRSYVSRTREEIEDQPREVQVLATKFLELTSDLELVRTNGWKMKGDGSIRSWRAWVDTVSWDIAELHRTALMIVGEDRRKINKTINDRDSFRNEIKIWEGRMRASDVELKGSARGLSDWRRRWTR